MARGRDCDIKAPDGFLLGGLRKVRADGTILFQRSWWVAPKEWIGEHVWVHNLHSEDCFDKIEAAPPGQRIYAARSAKTTIDLENAGRLDAKPGYRSAANKAWVARALSAASVDTHPQGGDAVAAPSPMSGAVPEGQTPTPSTHPGERP
jgi:hypothetical protein